MINRGQAQKLPRFIAVGGVARSGTTLLNRILRSHPQIMVFAEFGNFACLDVSYYRHIMEIQKRWWSNPLIRVSRNSLWSNNKSYNLLFITRYILKLLPYWKTPIDAEVIRRVLHDMFPNHLIVGDKFPNYIMKLERLTRIENMYPIIIYRDPRDVARSWIQKATTVWNPVWPHRRSEDIIEVFADWWVRGVDAMQAHAGQIFIIRYEELVRSPTTVMGKLGKWLGVTPDGFNCEEIHLESIGRYKKELSDDLVKSIQKIAGARMERLGYL